MDGWLTAPVNEVELNKLADMINIVVAGRDERRGCSNVLKNVDVVLIKSKYGIR